MTESPALGQKHPGPCPPGPDASAPGQTGSQPGPEVDHEPGAGYLALVLHAHLPFVKHPEHPSFLEEDWLFEAIYETYLPLLLVLRALRDDGVPFQLTLSLSPTLCQMLTDPLLRRRFGDYLERRGRLLALEERRTAGSVARLRALVRHYQDRLAEVRGLWQHLGGELLPAFAELRRAGHLDLLTCAATHGYLPLLLDCPEAVRAQIRVAMDSHQALLGHAPRGIWLPECGFTPGLDRILRDEGLRYFVADGHGLLLARPRPTAGTYRPIFCPGSGVAVFGRDLETSVQVWSRERGFPGHPSYREFYRDIGFDLDAEYLAPFIQPTGQRSFTGVKYHRITGPTDDKDLYDPARAREQAGWHAAEFVEGRRHQLRRAAALIGHPALVVSPYDAELFGHWWYEGPEWLDALIRRTAPLAQDFRLVHLDGYLALHPTQIVAAPAQSSWGQGGFHEYWLNDRTEWLYPHLHRAAWQMVGLARTFPEASGLRRRALAQAARELLLSQASDWAFILRSGTSVEYARQRIQSHLRRFARLHDDILRDDIDAHWLGRLERVDSLFQEIKYSHYI